MRIYIKKACFGMALVCLLLAGCRQQAAEVITPMGTFAVDGYRMLKEYAFAKPAADSEVFVLYLAGDESVNWDQMRLYSYFCIERPVKIAPEDGAKISAEGITLEVNEKSDTHRCGVIFKVPRTDARKWTVYWPDGEETEIKI